MQRFLCFPLLLGLVGALSAAEPKYPTLPLGSPAPDFKLPGADGKTWRLKDFSKSKVLVVIFTCNHCPTAQNYEERIKQLVTDYKPRGVGFVAITRTAPPPCVLTSLATPTWMTRWTR